VGSQCGKSQLLPVENYQISVEKLVEPGEKLGNRWGKIAIAIRIAKFFLMVRKREEGRRKTRMTRENKLKFSNP
jgi:hypothetical protein